jgi:hypothetical protein
VNLGDFSISGSGAICEITLSASSDSTIRIERAWVMKMGSEETPKTFGSQIRIEKHKPTYTEPLFSPNPYNPKLHKEISSHPK